MIYWFLPGIIFLGLITSYQDIKEGRIKNKWIICSLIYFLIIYAVIIFHERSYFLTFLEILAGGLFSLFIGFMLWISNIWTAGDAKLFFAYSLLIPMLIYEHGFLGVFSSMNILINTFVPVFLFLVLLIFIRTDIKDKLHFLKEAFRPWNLIRLLIFLMAFKWMISLFFILTGIPGNYFLVIMFLFLLMIIGERLFGMDIFKISAFFAVLRLIYDREIYTIAEVQYLISLLVVFVLLRFFVLNLGFHVLTKEVDIKLLERGMIPAELIYVEDNKYKKEELLHFSLLGYMRKRKRDYLFKAEELREEDVEKIKRLEKKLGFEHLRIQQTVPFAPFIFVGVLTTIIVKGNVLMFLRSF